MEFLNGQQVPTNADPAAQALATAEQTNSVLDMMKNATKGRWLAGWPIAGGRVISSSATTSGNTGALALLINGQVDIFNQAINNSAVLNGDLGTYPTGQQPWNNFLGSNNRPMKQMKPEAGGIYLGNLWDEVTGTTSTMVQYKSQIIENALITLYKNNNPESYIPWLTFAPGVRFDERAATTVANTTMQTQGFGELSPAGLRMFKDNEIWNSNTQLNMIISPTKPLQTYLASMVNQYTPGAGALIAFVGYGYEGRPVVSGT